MDKAKKPAALGIILLIYVFADIILVSSIMMLKDAIKSAVLVMFIADIAATVVVYISSLVFKNASVYDPYWSVMPVLMIIAWYIFYNINLSAYHLIVLIPLLIWSIRLTLNWALGFEDLTWEDWRYKKFKQDYPKIYQFICFTGIMLFPTILVFLGIIPIWFLINNSGFSLFHILGGAIILLAVILQGTADKQMKNFKEKNKNQNVCIDEGFWRYSRHPNYFGEICIWCGVAVAGLASINIISVLNITAAFFYVFNFLGAALMILLFLFVSIPLMEKHIISTRQGYIEYKNIVKSPLVPFFRRKI